MQRVWAWWWAGAIFYIPANLYPMLKTVLLGKETEATILGGVVELVHYGSYFVAAVVFFASICIPVAKFIAIAYLAIIIKRGGPLHVHRLHRIHELVEFIGRWSMIDVFVVAVLSALVHLSFVVNIHPGVAAICFALSVIFTMLSALSFDPRLIYDAAEQSA
ncbi:MAG: paraquat-inducible protein A [Pseudomonadota bacterium]